MTLGSRLLGQRLGDVDDAHVEPRVLQVRAAAGGVDGDRVDAGERIGHCLRHPFPLLAPYLHGDGARRSKPGSRGVTTS